jgi:predicted ester cyclase
MASQNTLSASEAAQTLAVNDEHRSLYLSYIEYCNAHDFNAMEKFYASPININDKPWSPSEVTAQFKPLVAAFPDWHWTIRHLTIENGYIALHSSVTGTHQGEFRGIQATGRHVTTSQFTLYRLEDGKFTDVWDLIDINSVVDEIKQIKLE